MNLTGRGPLGLKADKPERGTAEAKAYMAEVAKLPCVICGAWPVEVHHVISGRYSQRKASDFDTIPLCRWDHTQGPYSIHRNKTAWQNRHGMDTDYLEAVKKQLGRD